jgi:hypothetical protein
MNTKNMLLSLSLLASFPYALASDEVTQETVDKASKASHRIRRLLRKVLMNQHTIMKTLREILGLDELTGDIKGVLSYDETHILAVIVANQYEIISLASKIAGADLSREISIRSESLHGIPLILTNQHIIITILRQILNLDVEKFDEIVIENEVKGLRTVLENQDRIIALVTDIQKSCRA